MAKIKIGKTFTTVTPLSKALAMILFILFPFAGFYLGMKFQQKMSPQGIYYVSKQTTNSPNPSRIPIVDQNQRVDMSSWKSFVNSTYGYTFQYPSDWQLLGDQSADSDYIV